jgi:hypothetical protein
MSLILKHNTQPLKQIIHLSDISSAKLGNFIQYSHLLAKQILKKLIASKTLPNKYSEKENPLLELQRQAEYAKKISEILGENSLLVIDGYNPSVIFENTPQAIKHATRLGINSRSYNDEIVQSKYPLIESLKSRIEGVSLLTWGNSARILERFNWQIPARSSEPLRSGENFKEVVQGLIEHYKEELSVSYGEGEAGVLAHSLMEKELREKNPNLILMHSTGVNTFLYMLQNKIIGLSNKESKIKELDSILPNLTHLIFARGNCDEGFFEQCDQAICEFIAKKGIKVVNLYSPKDSVLLSSQTMTTTFYLKSLLLRLRRKKKDKSMSNNKIKPNGLNGFKVPDMLKENFYQLETFGDHGQVLSDSLEFSSTLSFTLQK